jgi:hypothetical protein
VLLTHGGIEMGQGLTTRVGEPVAQRCKRIELMCLGGQSSQTATASIHCMCKVVSLRLQRSHNWLASTHVCKLHAMPGLTIQPSPLPGMNSCDIAHLLLFLKSSPPTGEAGSGCCTEPAAASAPAPYIFQHALHYFSCARGTN